MIKKEAFKQEGHKVLQWIADYYNNLPSLPVKSQVKPREIYQLFPKEIPIEGSSVEEILSALSERILPGITHWQHPNFHAYFPANSSFESALAEFITASFGAQCMIWDTSPVAAELEEKVLDWLKNAFGIPHFFEGVIQDSASSATLVAILTARERSTNFSANKKGVPNNLRVYCSTEAHSSVEKGVKIAGIGSDNLVKISVDDSMAMDYHDLEIKISQDIKQGFVPCCVVCAIGSTSTLAIDPLRKIAELCKQHNIWLHVDAAYAGIATILPEYQYILDGVENVDSIVINAHKWMFTNFDCSLYYVKDAEMLIKTFEVLPEYLKTKTRGKVNDYRDWGIPLGRRFRALKLWFVIKSWGLHEIQNRIRSHIHLTKFAEKALDHNPHIEIMIPAFLNYLAFRINPNQSTSLESCNRINELLIEKINTSGELFITHTKMNGQYIIRLLFGQTYLNQTHVERCINSILSHASELISD